MHLAPVQGLAEHKDELGAPLCPCRHYDDKKLEAEQGFWNCPCVPMRERKVNKLAVCFGSRGISHTTMHSCNPGHAEADAHNVAAGVPLHALPDRGQ